MAYQIRVLDGLPAVELAYAGTVLPSELVQSGAECMNALGTHGYTRVLTDCTAMASGHGVFELLDKIEDLLKEYPEELLRVKEALVVGAVAELKARENVKFWETACRNRGLNVRTFGEREEALRWLLA